MRFAATLCLRSCFDFNSARWLDVAADFPTVFFAVGRFAFVFLAFVILAFVIRLTCTANKCAAIKFRCGAREKDTVASDHKLALRELMRTYLQPASLT